MPTDTVTPVLNVSPSRMFVTPGARAALAAASMDVGELVSRHLIGDWGMCDPEDAAANDRSASDGSRTLAAYPCGEGTIWVIADAALSACDAVMMEDHLFLPSERYALTVLLPSEY